MNPTVFCNQFLTALNITFQAHGRPRSATRRSVSNARRTRVPVMAQPVLEEGTPPWALPQSSSRPLWHLHLPTRRRKKVPLKTIYFLLDGDFFFLLRRFLKQWEKEFATLPCSKHVHIETKQKLIRPSWKNSLIWHLERDISVCCSV